MLLLNDQYLRSMSLSLLLLIVTASCAGYFLGKRSSGKSSQQTQIEVWSMYMPVPLIKRLNCFRTQGQLDREIKLRKEERAGRTRAEVSCAAQSRPSPVLQGHSVYNKAAESDMSFCLTCRNDLGN